jgi:GntR family transcriptional regulator/MocR family aminotransferase
VKRATSTGLILRLPEHCASKQAALYTALREAIITNAIGPNQRLPSTREFAQAHGISRGTAVIVYELLQAEGYLVIRRGAGTFVAPSLPDTRLVIMKGGAGLDPQPKSAEERVRAPAEALSRFGRQFASGTEPIEDGTRRPIAFAPYLPALDEFPISLWARLTAKHARLVKPDLLGHGYAAGLPRLRSAIAAYLKSTRGIDCRLEQIFLTSSTQQSLLRCARLVTEPGDRALIEDPGNPVALAALLSGGLAAVPVPVDSRGMQIGAHSQFESRPRLVYVTPAHQHPTGAVMSEERRRGLLAWAAGHDAWIFEDDDESEFRYHGHPAPALCALDRNGCVLHAGSFDKTLFPALCIGYLVVPPQLVDAFARAHASYGRNPPILSQLVLCDFIESGHFVRHVRRMGECYRERRAVLIDALRERLDGCVEIALQPCGLELAVRWKGERTAQAIAAASGAGLACVEPIPSSQGGSAVASGAVLGFAAYSPSMLRSAVDRLAGAVDDFSKGRLPVAGRDIPAVASRTVLSARQHALLAPRHPPLSHAGYRTPVAEHG